MNTKVNKLLKLTAAGLFLIALAINVKVTLDDPFVMLSEDAIATDSGGDESSSGGDGWWDTPEDEECPESQWTVVTSPSHVFTITVDTGISLSAALPQYIVTQLSATINGNKVTYTYTASGHSGILTETYKQICNDVFYFLGCEIKACRLI